MGLASGMNQCKPVGLLRGCLAIRGGDDEDEYPRSNPELHHFLSPPASQEGQGPPLQIRTSGEPVEGFVPLGMSASNAWPGPGTMFLSDGQLERVITGSPFALSRRAEVPAQSFNYYSPLPLFAVDGSAAILAGFADRRGGRPHKRLDLPALLGPITSGPTRRADRRVESLLGG